MIILAKLYAISAALFAMFLVAGAYSTISNAKTVEILKSVERKACINKYVNQGHPTEVIEFTDGKCLIDWGNRKPKPWGFK